MTVMDLLQAVADGRVRTDMKVGVLDANGWLNEVDGVLLHPQTGTLVIRLGETTVSPDVVQDAELQELG